MHLTAAAKSTLEYLLTIDVPKSTWIDVDVDGRISAQCATQLDVRAFRAAFGAGVVWKKAFAEYTAWWTYDATLPNGMRVHVYACREAPPTCKAIVEEIEVEEKVPVEWATKMVKKERVRWDCGSGEESQS